MKAKALSFPYTLHLQKTSSRGRSKNKDAEGNRKRRQNNGINQYRRKT